MKKNILSMAVLLMASAAVFTACSSDDNVTSEQPANPTGKYTMTVNASKGGDATTRALTLDETTSPHKLNATWDANEVVLVYQGGSQIGTLYSAASTTNETTLTGTLDSAPNAAQDLTLYFHTNATPSYTGQDGTLATIASTYDFCAPATIATGNFTVKGNTVSTSSSVSFGANQQSIVKFTLKNGETLLKAGTVRVQATAYGYHEIFDIVFTIPDDTYTTNGNGVIYLAIPNTSSYFSSQAIAIGGTTPDAIKNSCKLNITATVGFDTYTYTKSGWPFDDGQYYEIGVKMTKQAPRTLAEATAEDIGKVAGADGKIYANVAAAQAASTTACAIIAYVGSATGEDYYTHGLAIAMKDAAAGGYVIWSSSKNDESLTNYTDVSQAVSTPQSGLSNSQTYEFDNESNYPAFYAALHNTITTSDGISADAPDSGTSIWFLPSLYQWNKIVQGLSGQSANLSDAPNANYTASSLNTKIVAAGGDGLQSDGYWSSTEYDGDIAWLFDTYSGLVTNKSEKVYEYLVRSAFAF